MIQTNYNYTYTYGVDTTPPRAAVISHTVAVFDPNCPPQDEQDIKDALCLAQLAAVLKYPSHDQTVEYFNEIKTILCDTGFTNVADFNWNEVDTSLQDFTIGTHIQTIFTLIAGDLVQKSLTALKRHQESSKPAWQILSRDFKNNSSGGKFSLGVVETDGKNTKLTMTAYKMQSDQITDNFLWVNLAPQNFRAHSAKAEFILNSELYGEKFRAPVQEKLGTMGKTFIADLDI